MHAKFHLLFVEFLFSFRIVFTIKLFTTIEEICCRTSFQKSAYLIFSKVSYIIGRLQLSVELKKCSCLI